MRIVPVPVRHDNYAYLLIDDVTHKAAAIDPFDVPKVAAAAEKEGVVFESVITTHHHHDHAGGNKAFVKKFPSTPVYGGSHTVEGLTKQVKNGDTFTVGENIEVMCMATPCHTQDSICYYVTDKKDSMQKGVFTGDTLFQGGCGRFFEGTGDEMVASLKYLGTLPDSTVVYNGHEYTKDNLAFARSVDPSNPALQSLQDLVSNNPVTTGKSTIGDEKKWNVFMRTETDVIRKATGMLDDSGKTMEQLRSMKNNFKG